MLRAIPIAVLTFGAPLLGCGGDETTTMEATTAMEATATTDEATVTMEPTTMEAATTMAATATTMDPFPTMDPALLLPRVADKRKADEPVSYMPSAASLEYAKLYEYTEASVTRKLDPPQKILVLATSEYLLPTSDGRLFNTGHHSTEMFLPLHHFDAAGFEFDFATENGEEVAIEEWTWDLAVGYKTKLESVRAKYMELLKNPKNYTDITDLSGYAAIFLPGGHGPLISMQFDDNLTNILSMAKEVSMTTISLCHGPVSLALVNESYNTAEDQYTLAVFPDAQDQSSPAFGYLPSALEEKYQAEAKLIAAGFKVNNTEMDDTVVVDRELVTGASQLASQKLSEKALEKLAEKHDFEVSFPSSKLLVM